MDIVVKGRNVEVPEHYRTHVTEKLSRLERYDRKVVRFDVELFHEPNRRQSKNCQKVEITVFGRGPVIRSAARAADFYSALDSAISKLSARLRRLHDRRRVHYGKRPLTSVAAATTSPTPLAAGQLTGVALLEREPVTNNSDQHVLEDSLVPRQRSTSASFDGYSTELGQVREVREYSAKPMSIDQALSAMELVGHDFYLYHDAELNRPSVVYRRKGFDYGVVRLS